MPELTMTSKLVNCVNYGDLEAFIDEVYGHAFSVPEDVEGSNDTTYAFNDVRPEPLSEYDGKKLAGFKTSGHGRFLLRILLTDLCNRGMIPPGDYIVVVSW